MIACSMHGSPAGCNGVGRAEAAEDLADGRYPGEREAVYVGTPDAGALRFDVLLDTVRHYVA